MTSFRVLSTSDRDLPPPNFAAELNWERLTEILLREVSSEAAGLLAEPIRDKAQDQTHWHITARDAPKPIADLSDSERDRLFNRLRDRRREVQRFATSVEVEGGKANRRLADALRAALNVPDERRHIWSADGKPVLTAWGRQLSTGRSSAGTDLPSSEPAASGTKNAVAARSPWHDEEAGLAVGARSPLSVATTSRRRRRSAILLWALFVGLAGAILYTLLPACGLNLPLLSFDRCQSGPLADLAKERQRHLALRGAINASELRLAEKQTACARPQHAEPLNDRAEPRHLDAREADQRRADAKASKGRLDITLVWNGREDLDLHVYCPGGQIYFKTRSACGGLLEIDRNATLASAREDPLEHVTWPDDPPAGAYRIEVVLFDRFGLPPREIPFTVVVRDSEGEREFPGRIRKAREPAIVTNFRR